MIDVQYRLDINARKDLESIRNYTIDKWGLGHWYKYKNILQKKMQMLANNPNLGLQINEISENAFRFPDEHHVFYYMQKGKSIVFVGVISNKLAPQKHIKRIHNLGQKID